MIHRSLAALAALFVGHAAATAAHAQTLDKIARTNQIVVRIENLRCPSVIS